MTNLNNDSIDDRLANVEERKRRHAARLEAAFSRQEARMDAMTQAVCDNLDLPFIAEGPAHGIEKGQRISLYRGRFTLNIVAEVTREKYEECELSIAATTRFVDTDPNTPHTIRLCLGDTEGVSFNFQDFPKVQTAMGVLFELADVLEKAAVEFNKAAFAADEEAAANA